MNIAVCQISIGESLKNNTAKIIAFIKEAYGLGIKLICFPEMCLTGYDPELLLRKDLNHLVDGALKQIEQTCRQLNLAAIIGHAYLKQEQHYNRATAILPDGNCYSYDKMFLTEQEKKYFKAGSNSLLFTFKDITGGIIICRDQNYPLLAKKFKEKGADVLFILSAHYYDPKEARWKLEKNRAIPIARAVENKFYVFMANTVGSHLGMISLGNSLIADPEGAVVVSAGETQEIIMSFNIDYQLEKQILTHRGGQFNNHPGS